jgi:hypothetical protein
MVKQYFVCVASSGKPVRNVSCVISGRIVKEGFTYYTFLFAVNFLNFPVCPSVFEICVKIFPKFEAVVISSKIITLNVGCATVVEEINKDFLFSLANLARWCAAASTRA